MNGGPRRKPLFWMGSSRADLLSFPADVMRSVGYALHAAQIGEKHPDAKPLVGFGGPTVLEVVEDFEGNSYRAVYTVRFARAVYVLHVFQKKSKRGVATPTKEANLIRNRLKRAEEDYATWCASET